MSGEADKFDSIPCELYSLVMARNNK